MSVKCVVADTSVIEVNRERYDELVAKENRLQMLENAIAEKGNYSNIEDIKTIFNLEKGAKENECSTLDTNNI